MDIHFKKIIRKQIKRCLTLGNKGLLYWMSDEAYLKLFYHAALGKKLNLDSPVTFNEKIQWLKLHDRKQKYISMVDKYEVKKYVSSLIGEEYLIPTLGIWDKFEDIDFERLPDRFVLKCTHDSGGIVICKDKNYFDVKTAEKKLNACLKFNYYWVGREWVYKNVKPRIIAEPYLEDEETKELRDYKFFTFDGTAKALFIGSDRQNPNEEVKFDFFDMDFNCMHIKNGHPNAKILPKKPKNFDKMRSLAEKLSKEIPHVRVDFYEVNGRLYFGEFTFAHGDGILPFEPECWDKTFGDWIKLPSV